MTAHTREAGLRDLNAALETAANQAKALSEHTVFYLVHMAIDDLHEEERLAGPPARPKRRGECAVFRINPHPR